MSLFDEVMDELNKKNKNIKVAKVVPAKVSKNKIVIGGAVNEKFSDNMVSIWEDDWEKVADEWSNSPIESDNEEDSSDQEWDIVTTTDTAPYTYPKQDTESNLGPLMVEVQKREHEVAKKEAALAKRQAELDRIEREVLQRESKVAKVEKEKDSKGNIIFASGGRKLDE